MDVEDMIASDLVVIEVEDNGGRWRSGRSWWWEVTARATLAMLKTIALVRRSSTMVAETGRSVCDGGRWCRWQGGVGGPTKPRGSVAN
ncbi:hypothetical protein U1Q18_029444 [Sarracenia purpurea var. burkii]